MKFRQHSAEGKIEMQMSAMIDIVFQLLIFFTMTLRIVAPEGDFNINMPLGASAPDPDRPPPQEMRVRLEANPDGSLRQLSIGERGLGNQPQAFEALSEEIRAWVAASGQLADELEVELVPDYNIDFRHTIRAYSACRGRFVNGNLVTYVEKIKFAPIQRPDE